MPRINEVTGQIRPEQGKADSLLITCANYEERSIAVAKQLAADYCVDHTLIFRAKEYVDKGSTPEYFDFINEKMTSVGVNGPKVIEFSSNNSIPAMREFESFCYELQKKSSFTNVTIDISAFPRRELLMLLSVLDNMTVGPQIRIFYTEPVRYNTENIGGWLTRGVTSVRPVPGFGGVQPPNKKKNLLLMFLGHEEERAAITWKRHQPRKMVAVVPDPNYRIELNGIVEKTHQPLFTKLSETEFYPSIPARGIEESEKAVLSIWEQHFSSYYIVIAPLGTKLQTLGIYRAVRQRPDIQITYAIPSIYNYQNFSIGIERIWEISWN